MHQMLVRKEDKQCDAHEQTVFISKGNSVRQIREIMSIIEFRKAILSFFIFSMQLWQFGQILQMFDTMLWYRVSLEDLFDEFAVVILQFFDALANVRRE